MVNIFNLGEYENNYITTSKDQSKNIDSKNPIPVSKLNDTIKNDLVSSHFKFGNEIDQYLSEFKNEFTNKRVDDLKNIKKLGILLRNHNYNLGSDKISYLTETQEKYTTPSIQKDIKINPIINSQKVNYKIGSDIDDWKTTAQISYIPNVI